VTRIYVLDKELFNVYNVIFMKHFEEARALIFIIHHATEKISRNLLCLFKLKAEVCHSSCHLTFVFCFIM
jgi:hypothetical protein